MCLRAYLCVCVCVCLCLSLCLSVSLSVCLCINIHPCPCLGTCTRVLCYLGFNTGQHHQRLQITKRRGFPRCRLGVTHRASTRGSYPHVVWGRGPCSNSTESRIFPFFLSFFFSLSLSQSLSLSFACRETRGRDGWLKSEVRRTTMRHLCSALLKPSESPFMGITWAP